MKGILILVFCAVYSVQAWNEILGPLYIEGRTGRIPEKYLPLSTDDKNAIRKGASFVGFIKHMPQVNPLQLPSLGPYHIALPDVNVEANLQLSNVVVNGLKNLALNDLEMRINPSRVDFNVSIPEVSASADFQLNGVYGGQPLSVNGHLSTTLKDLLILVAEGNKLVQVGGHQVYQIDSGEFKLHLGSIQISLNMNQYVEQFRAYLVHFLQNTARYPDSVNNVFRNVLSAVSVELAKIPANDILNYLIGSGKPPLLF